MVSRINSDSVMEEICNNPKEIVIYGAGHYGRVIKKYLETIYDTGIKCFMVSSAQNCTEKRIDGTEVKCMDELAGNEQKCQLIIAISEQKQDALLNAALKNGYKDIRLVLNEFIRYMESQLNKDHLMPLEKMNFEVHVTEHCNLNCKGCYHFSPLSGESFLSTGEFKRDMEQMKRLCGDRVSSITLLGGEPLLHPQITDFFEITREFFKECRIKLLTNGILLNQMDETFWKSCHQNNVSLFCTKYPINIDYDALGKKAEEYGLRISYHNDVNAGDKSLIKYPFDLTGKQPVSWNYRHCTRSNKCITLKHGRLFTCPMAAHAHLAKTYFNLDMELSGEDSIDIYSAENFESLTQFLIKPIPFCRYCNLKIRPEQQKWGVSKKDISEWF